MSVKRNQIFRKGREQCVACYNHFKAGNFYHDLEWGKVHTTCWDTYPESIKGE